MINRRNLALGAPFLLVACKSTPAPTPAPPGRIGSQTPPIAGGWIAQHSVNTTLVAQGGGFYFDFPRPPGSVHYIVKPSGPIQGALKMSFRLSGGGVLQPLQTAGGGVQTRCAVRPYFQREGDNLSGQGPYAGYRWWAAPYFLEPTATGIIDRSVPLHAEHWSCVFPGQCSPSDFTNAMAHAGMVGFTFGSESFAGHGVQCASGSVRFELISFSVGVP